jgi:hypothetical protein
MHDVFEEQWRQCSKSGVSDIREVMGWVDRYCSVIKAVMKALPLTLYKTGRH